MSKVKTPKKYRILNFIHKNNRWGVADYEIVKRLRIPINLVTKHRHELIREGKVKFSGRKKENPTTKKNVKVWKVTTK